MARRVGARRVVASAAEVVRGSNRNPLRTTPGKARRGSLKNRYLIREARRGSLKNFASRFARLVFHGYLFVTRYQYHRYQISVLVSFISDIGIDIGYRYLIGISSLSLSHRYRCLMCIGVSS